MEIEKAVYAVTRLINIAGQQMNAVERKRYIEKKVALLSEGEKQSLVTVLKAVALLVNGDEMEVLRDPDKYDEWIQSNPDFGDPWDRIFSMAMIHSVQVADPSFDVNSKPKKEDWVMAKKVLTAVGSSSVSSKAALDIDPNVASSANLLGGYKTLYRGLNDVSDRIIRRVANKKPWSIKHGVSTSYEKQTAVDFAGMMSDGTTTNGPAIFFTINNPKKKGFIADTLSDFGEYEVVLSGDFQINKWILSANGRMSARYYDKTKNQNVQRGIRTLMQANSETMEIKFIYKEHFRKVDYLSFTDKQKFLDALDKYAFNQGTFETDKLGMPNNVSKWSPNRKSVLIAADVTLK